MRIRLVALLSALLSGAVSCATGSGNLAASSTGGSGGSPSDGAPDPGEGAGGSPGAVTTNTPSISTGSGESTTAAGPATSYVSTPPLLVTREIAATYDMDLSCTDVPILHACIVAASGDQNVAYVLPPGMKRTSILYTITPSGPNASGAVTFANADPEDGTVHMHGHAGPFSSVHIEVTGVMAIAE